jgi:hypothetical protein
VELLEASIYGGGLFAASKQFGGRDGHIGTNHGRKPGGSEPKLTRSAKGVYKRESVRSRLWRRTSEQRTHCNVLFRRRITKQIDSIAFRDGVYDAHRPRTKRKSSRVVVDDQPFGVRPTALGFGERIPPAVGSVAVVGGCSPFPASTGGSAPGCIVSSSSASCCAAAPASAAGSGGPSRQLTTACFCERISS